MKKLSPFFLSSTLIFSALLLIAATLPGCGKGLSLQYGGGEKPPAEGTLTLYDIGPITLDPAISQEMRSHFYVVHVFSGLVSLDENMKVVPDLASRWDISEDGKVYTFYIKPEAKFQNGRPVKAEDIKFSWERAANPQTRSPTAQTYLGSIEGVDEVLQGKANEISGLKILNDSTLQIKLKEPKASFLPRLTYPVAFAVDREDVRKSGEWWRNPNGSGPFKLRQWRKDELLELEASDLYYGEGPFIKRVVFRLYAGIPLRLYEQNEIDAADVSIANIDMVRDVSNPLSKQLNVYAELSSYYLSFNVSKPPFDDVNVRKAFVQAVDKEKIVRLSLKGTVRTAMGIIPAGMPGFDAQLKGPGYDIQAARESLARSRYGSAANLPPVMLTTSGRGAAVSDYLSAIIQQWKQNLGIEVEVRVLEPEIFFYNFKEVIDNIYDFGWVADYPDPENFLDILFHSDRPNNAGKYSNPELDSLLDEASTEKNESRRIELYRKAEKVIVEEAALLPLWFGQNFVLVKPGIQNYKYTPLGFPMLNKVYLGPVPTPSLTPGPSPVITLAQSPVPTPVITPVPSPSPAPATTFLATPGPEPLLSPALVLTPVPAPVQPPAGINALTITLLVILVLIVAGIIIYLLSRGKKRNSSRKEST